jgi:NAD(P)H-hydrate epimerase
MVIDADGLMALAGHTDLLRKRQALTVLTPHPGEMAALLKTTTEEVQRDRVGIALHAAETFRAIVVLKGARTIVAAPDGALFVNPTGNAGMATGGTGDVLTGMVASLLAQTLCRSLAVTPTEAVAAAVFLHGLAGDIASWEKGETALVAGDLLEHLPRAILEPELSQPITLRPLSPFVRFVLRYRR